MKISKKSYVLVALLLVIANNSYSMDNSTPWLNTVNAALFSSPSKVRQILLTANPFAGLPTDMNNEIVGILLAGSNADSLDVAAQTIGSLALVNKELHKYLNDPKICLKIIKNFAQRFNCSDEEAAEKLPLAEAKNRLKLQENFIEGIHKDNDVLANKFSLVESFIKKGADVNFTGFTYSEKNEQSLLKNTPLTAIVSGTQNIKDVAACVLLCLQHGGNPDVARPGMETARTMVIAYLKSYPELIKRKQSQGVPYVGELQETLERFKAINALSENARFN